MLTWYDDDDEGRPYGKGSDMWSLGVLLYVILSGCRYDFLLGQACIVVIAHPAEVHFFLPAQPVLCRGGR